MKCYTCKQETKTATRVFMPARNRRERAAYRDLCFGCYVNICIRDQRHVRLLNVTASERAFLDGLTPYARSFFDFTVTPPATL